MSSGERSGPTKVSISVDDGWGVDEGWSDVGASSNAVLGEASVEGADDAPDVDDGGTSEEDEDISESDVASPIKQSESQTQRAAADTNAALEGARAALLESRAIKTRSAPEEADVALASAPAEDDDGAVAAFRAKTQLRQHKLAIASEQSKVSPRKNLFVGLAGGLIVGMGIGWFASRATISNGAVPDRAASEPTSVSAPVAESQASPEPRALAASNATAEPKSTDDTEDPPVTTIDEASNDEPAAAASEASVADAGGEDSADKVAPVDDTPVEAAPVDGAPSSAAAAPGIAVTSPREGVITKVFAKTGQRVWKGERLFEVSRQASAAEEAALLEQKIAELDALQDRNEAQEAERSEAKRKVDLFKTGFRGDRKSVAYAPEGGYVEDQPEKGALVKLGDVVCHLRELEK